MPWFRDPAELAFLAEWLADNEQYTAAQIVRFLWHPERYAAEYAIATGGAA